MSYRVKFDTSSVVGTASGAASPVLLDAMSAISYGSMLDVGLKGCIGAAAGFLTTLLIKKALKAMKIKVD